jgi:hypothetical protein
VIKLSICLVAAVACGKSNTGKEDGEEAARDYVVGSVKDDLPKIKAALASAKPDDATFKCGHMANLQTLEKADAALAAEFKRLCTHDLQLDIMKVEVDKAEAARKAKPDEKVLSECFNANFELAGKELQQYGTGDDTSKALAARFAAACPKQR